MRIITRKEYQEILKNTKIDLHSKKNLIDIYHRNNWDHLVMHWDEINVNENVSYIDFFFDSKIMVDFLKKWLANQKFSLCYFSCAYDTTFKIIKGNGEVCQDVYDEFKRLINSLGLKTNTNKAVEMTKGQFISWCSRFSIGGFLGISEFSILIPELELLIQPYHHMNFLMYCKDRKTLNLSISDFLRTWRHGKHRGTVLLC